ncbi:LuxR C-terminal-related transcriptional regulator [Rhodococcus sp. UFZ-B548]|uniref:ATP-binding protein n=1 Tax=Rhodococcus sp. UFZ-B548 TaxID=2742212 RepID=UPI0015F3D985|nr:LuxR C-terminal-related transcriptional regulator [Rhodococcus sp. UFZ-B548]
MSMIIAIESDNIMQNVHSKTNLPVEFTSFVGRRHELMETKRLLALTRLVTLTGAGGIGKTRLAARVAGNVRRAFDEGVYLIELGDIDNLAHLVDKVTSVVGLETPPTKLPLRHIAESIAGKRMLLVLDNCEHLIVEAVEAVTILLRQCPSLHILVTSREPLGIGGEAVLRVPQLAVPDSDRIQSLEELEQYDAVTLFTQRAELAEPGFELSDENQRAVSRLCQRLDGLPLAIELVAARLQMMAPQQILDQLSGRYHFLTSGNRGAPRRQRTMRLSTDWSYELCELKEQKLWCLLSVFSGGFEIDAAESMCTEFIERELVLEVLARLVDKSILVKTEVGDKARYWQLECLREYGKEKLQENGNIELVRRCHRDWCQNFVQWVEDNKFGPHQKNWINRLKCEETNLGEALRFCLTEGSDDDIKIGLQISRVLSEFWMIFGSSTDGRILLDSFLHNLDGQATSSWIRAMSARALLAGIEGDFKTGSELVSKIRIHSDIEIDQECPGVILSTEGFHGLFSGDIMLALHCFEAGARVDRIGGDNSSLITNLIGLELAAGLLGDLNRATICKEEVVAISEIHGTNLYRGYSLWALAFVEWRADPVGASSLLQECVKLARVSGDRLMASLSLEVMAWISSAKNVERDTAVLLGAASSLSQSVAGSEVIPALAIYRHVCVRQARFVLEVREFDDSLRNGESMSFEKAIAYALGDTRWLKSEPRSAAVDQLTKRERQVAGLISEGLTNRAIAAKLVISQRTAEGHVEHILAKLAFTSRAQVAVWVVAHGEAERRRSASYVV